MSLSVVEREYLKVLRPELAAAIRNGEPDRAASFARAIARLHRKAVGRTRRAPAESNSRREVAT